MKVHEKVEVGHGRHLTIALTQFVIDMTHMSRLMAASSQKVASALGVDVTPAIRQFARDCSLEGDRFASELGDDAFVDVRRSARWYLKGAREGPTPDGIVWLCTAIECLVDPPPGKQKKNFNKAALERAVIASGADPTRFQPDLGRVAGLRSRVVHYGEEEPERLRDGFYILEEVSRLLIRSRLKAETKWPCAVPSPKPDSDAIVVEKRYRHGSEWVDPPQSA